MLDFFQGEGLPLKPGDYQKKEKKKKKKKKKKKTKKRSCWRWDPSLIWVLQIRSTCSFLYKTLLLSEKIDLGKRETKRYEGGREDFC